MDYLKDLTGFSPANLVKDHYTRPTDRATWFFVPSHGVFYTKDLVVRNIVTNDILAPLAQYRVLEINKEATLESGGLETATIILINDPTVFQVEVTRQVVGGEYAVIGTDLESIINENDLQALSATSWGQVVGKPYQFTPQAHTHAQEQLYGFEHVVYLLNEIADATRNGDSGMYGAIHQYIDLAIAQAKTQIEDQLNRLNRSIDQFKIDAKLKVGQIVIFNNATDPATAFGYGQWKRLENTVIYAASSNADLGEIAYVGQGEDVAMTGFACWMLIAI